MAFYIGVDAGGSKCRSRLINENGRILGAGQAGAANAGIGIANLKTVLNDVLRQAIDAAGLDETEIGSIRAGFGIAGASRPDIQQPLKELGSQFFSSVFNSDALIANLGAHAGSDGAILILGTGSIAYVQVNGKGFTLGGYGFPISDEGSGAALGLSGMRHSLRSLDGRTRKTPLGSAISAKFDHDTVKAVAWMDTASPGDYATFAPLIMEYAEANDPIARSIVEDAAQHVERFIETIFERGAPACALAGGLAPRMRLWLRQRTADRLVQPKGDPLDGALRLAGFRGAIGS